VIALCEELGRRARAAALRGEASFAFPEGTDAAKLIAAAPDTMLAADAEGWRAGSADYHGLVRLAARAVVGWDPGAHPSAGAYLAKAGGELEPMLALWPQVLVLPTAERLSRRDLILLRAFPVHPLGLVTVLSWADGAPSPPSEYFFHDLDHARFKVREDLLALGLELPDAYQDGSTLDPGTGRHRIILPLVEGRLGGALWERASERLSVARALLERIDLIADATLARAAELLLFEIIHEKSFPLDRVVVARELRADAHAAKIQRKRLTGFFGDDDPGSAVVAMLPEARRVLGQVRL
jgi:hypothetical protein